MNSNFSRRALLAGLGVSSAAATFLPWLRPSKAASAIPTRLLLFWAGSGVPRHRYKITSASGGSPTETDFVFPSMRSPLNAIKNDLITFGNLDMVSKTVDPTPASNAHYDGETHSLAAVNRANGDTAGGPSLDQYVAAALTQAGQITKVPSLSLAAQTDGNTSGVKVCTPTSGQVISLEPDPAAVYSRLFSGFQATGAPSPGGPSPAEIALAQQKSVLDTVLADFADLGPGLSTAAKTKLEAHAQAVRDFEQRLTLPSGVGAKGPACSDPGAGVVAGAHNAWPGDSALYRRNLDSMFHLVQSAFACDLTRVALLAAGEPFADQWGYTSGAWGTSDAHDLIHKTSYNGAGVLKDDAAAIGAVEELHRVEAQQFVDLVSLLRQIPEQDGGTLLDHTVVLWCSQIGEHGHDVDYLPWVLAGGAKAGFKPGRYLDYPRINGKGVPHNNLFVSIAQAMGINTNTFGNPDVCTGPLDRLRV